MSRDMGRARLPALPSVQTDNASLRAWIQAATERMEVREGSRGNDAERALTRRDLAGISRSETVARATWPDAFTSVDDFFANGFVKTRTYDDLLRRIKRREGDLGIVDTTKGGTSSTTVIDGGPGGEIAFVPPQQLSLARNDLDFWVMPDVPSFANTAVCTMQVTVDTSQFFSNNANHVAFAMDCEGGQGSGNPNWAPIVRNGRNLHSLARGCFVRYDSTVWVEHWNGTASPGTAQMASFNVNANPVFTLRLSGGYRNGPMGGVMEVSIVKGVNGPSLAYFTVPWGWDWTGTHRCTVGGIGAGFVSPGPGQSEDLSPRLAPNAKLFISNARVTAR